MELQFDFDESFEIEAEIIKQEELNDAYNHALNIDPMSGLQEREIYSYVEEGEEL